MDFQIIKIIFIALICLFSQNHFVQSMPSEIIKTQLSFPHGHFEVSENGQKYTFFCNEEYTLKGDKEIFYINNKWTNDTPVCVRIDTQISFPHGRYVVSENGKKYSFSCDEQFYLQGEKEIYFLNNKWTNSTPICISMTDGKLDQEKNSCPGAKEVSLQNGHVEKVQNLCKFKFQCGNDFTLIGDNEIELLDMKWSSSMPLCVSDQVLRLQNGNFQVKVDSGKNKILYNCIEGYELIGNREIDIFGDKLNDKKPFCFPLCPRIELDNGQMEINQETHVVNFFCNDGFKLSGVSSSVCENGKWSNDPPVCYPLCEKINLKNGEVFYNLEDIAIFGCNENYTLVGNQQSVCKKGKWQESSPICVPKCQELIFTPAHKILQYSIEEDHYKLACVEGFTLKGNDEITCEFGQWNYPMPSCLYTPHEHQFTNGFWINSTNY